MHQAEQNREISNFVAKGLDSVRKSRSDNPFFGVTSSRSGFPESAIALKFISRNGRQLALHYHDILSPLDYDGAEKITLSTVRVQIVIAGSNLEELFDYILEHRVKWISEPQTSFENVENGKPVIDSIEFEDLE